MWNIMNLGGQNNPDTERLNRGNIKSLGWDYDKASPANLSIYIWSYKFN